ncbi:DNA-packaging protein, partial [Vibrio phage 1.135.O._10N.222.54.B6]
SKSNAGRPSKYDDSFLGVTEKYLAQGKSVTQLAKHLNVAKSTIYKWAEENKEFSDALNIGREFSQAHWEDKLEDMMFNKDVNSPLVKLYFANRFGWSDKVESKNENANVEKVKSFSEMYGNVKS